MDATEWNEHVTNCLRHAGWTLIRLKTKDHKLGVKISDYGPLPEPDGSPRLLSLPMPSAFEIDHMDRVLGWLPLLTNATHRKVVGFRMLYDMEREKCLFSFRDIGKKLGFSHQAVMYWNNQAMFKLGRTLKSSPRTREDVAMFVRRNPPEKKNP